MLRCSKLGPPFADVGGPGQPWKRRKVLEGFAEPCEFSADEPRIGHKWKVKRVTKVTRLKGGKQQSASFKCTSYAAATARAVYRARGRIRKSELESRKRRMRKRV